MKALIVDDEPLPAKDLKELIEKHCFEVTYTEILHSPIKAIERLREEHFDLLFLDVEMPQINGIELLKRIQPMVATHVIFTTAYSNYALDAFDLDAVHYIVKPVDENELIKSLRKVQNQRIKSGENSGSLHKTISVFDADGYQLIPQENIIRIEGDEGYSKIILEDKDYLSSKRLGYYEERMDSGIFMRIHRSHIINLNRVSRVSKGETAHVTLANGNVIPISSSKLLRLKERLKI